MNTKVYTDINQSKILSAILPLDSADMYYDVNSDGILGYPQVIVGSLWNKDIPCWSLAALMSVIKGKLCHYDGSYYCQFIEEGEDFPIYSTSEYDNPIDCCVELIVELNKRGLL